MPHRTTALAILLALLAIPVSAQDAPAEADPFVFTTDAAMIMWQVRPDKVPDFELVWRIVRERAETQGSAEVKELVATIRLYQVEVTGGETISFVTHIDPVTPGASYGPTYLLFESGLFERGEADELFALLTGALAETNPVSTMPLSTR